MHRTPTTSCHMPHATTWCSHICSWLQTNPLPNATNVAYDKSIRIELNILNWALIRFIIFSIYWTENGLTMQHIFNYKIRVCLYVVCKIVASHIIITSIGHKMHCLHLLCFVSWPQNNERWKWKTTKRTTIEGSCFCCPFYTTFCHDMHNRQIDRQTDSRVQLRVGQLANGAYAQHLAWQNAERSHSLCIWFVGHKVRAWMLWYLQF